MIEWFILGYLLAKSSEKTVPTTIHENCFGYMANSTYCHRVVTTIPKVQLSVLGLIAILLLGIVIWWSKKRLVV